MLTNTLERTIPLRPSPADKNVVSLKARAPSARNSAASINSPAPNLQPVIPKSLETWLPENMVGAVRAIALGEMDGPTNILATQALALDSIFHSLLERMADANKGHPEKLERLLRMALSTQGRCQSALESVGRLRQAEQLRSVGYDD